jgi:hypothetical protein
MKVSAFQVRALSVAYKWLPFCSVLTGTFLGVNKEREAGEEDFSYKDTIRLCPHPYGPI